MTLSKRQKQALRACALSILNRKERIVNIQLNYMEFYTEMPFTEDEKVAAKVIYLKPVREKERKRIATAILPYLVQAVQEEKAYCHV